MTSSTLAQWLHRLEGLHPTQVDLGLERVAAVARTLDLLPLPCPVVTVAGTNGKGSTVAVLEALALAAGRRVGAFTSPHLQRFNERIRVDGAEAADADIVQAFAAIDAARGETSLTYFEFSALAALCVFRRHAADLVVLEVGLGGRLDAVNIVDADVAVITAIALDHQDWLGSTREQIALEKAGILRPGRAAVIADPEPPASLRGRVAQLGASPALYLGEDFGVAVGEGRWRGWLQQDGERRDIGPLADGPLLPANVCGALQAAALLGCAADDTALAGVLRGVRLPGRRQALQRDGLDYVVDVAHNPAAVDKLLEYLNATSCAGKTIAVFSAMEDKDLEGMVAAAAGSFHAWFLGDQPDVARAARAADIARLLHAAGEERVSLSRNLRQALARARSVAAPGDRLVVFGSFYTVGALLPRLERAGAPHEALS